MILTNLYVTKQYKGYIYISQFYIANFHTDFTISTRQIHCSPSDMLFAVFVYLLQLAFLLHMGFKISGGTVVIDLSQLIFAVAEDFQQIVVVYL